MNVETMLREVREELRSLREELKRGHVEPTALLSMKSAAKRLGVGPTTLRLLVAKGIVGTVPLGGRKKVPASEIDRITAVRPPRRRARPPRKPKPVPAPPDPSALRRWARTQKG